MKKRQIIGVAMAVGIVFAVSIGAGSLLSNYGKLVGIAELTCEDKNATFTHPFEDVTSSTSEWSTTDNAVNLNTTIIYFRDGNVTTNQGKLTHRGTRGLGISLGEFDEIDRSERLTIQFDVPMVVKGLELRSLFNESCGVERATIEFYGKSYVSRDVSADQNSNTGVLYVDTTGLTMRIDKIVLSAPSDGHSEFSLAKLVLCK